MAEPASPDRIFDSDGEEIVEEVDNPRVRLIYSIIPLLRTDIDIPIAEEG